MREWLSGRASPCQGERREFESRLPLQKRTTILIEWSFFLCLCPEGHNIILKRSFKHHFSTAEHHSALIGHNMMLYAFDFISSQLPM